MHPSIYLDGDSQDDRSLYISENICHDTELISIPDKCRIKADGINNTCILLIKEFANPDSFYRPYLNLLPCVNNLQHLPLYKYTPETLPNLPTFKNTLIYYFNQAIELLNLLVKEELPETFKTFHWALYAMALYHSRAWGRSGFNPLIDLIQHENNTNLTNSVNESEEWTKFFTRKMYGMNTKLSWCYSKSNKLSLYTNYGIDHTVDQDYFPIKFNFDSSKASETLLNFINDVLKRNKIYFYDKDVINLVFTPELDEKLFNTVRMLLLNDSEVELLKEKQIDLSFDKKLFISARNELLTFKVLLKQLENYSKNFVYNGDDIIIKEICFDINNFINNSKEILKEKWLDLIL